MRRTLLLTICGILLAAGLSTTTVVTAAPAAAVTDPDAPGVLWGAYPNERPGESEAQALQRARKSAGRELGAVRRFYLWDHDSSFPGPMDRELIDRGSTMVVTVKPELRSGAGVSWSTIANAKPGDAAYTKMQSWARRFRDLDVPVYVTFNHEPEAKTNEGRGTSAQFIEAWRQWVRVFRSEGADNVRFLWIMTDYSFAVPSSDRRAAARWYPGDSWVHGIAADSYNWYRCRPGISTPWMSLREVIEPQRQFWLDHQSEELWLTEFGSVEDPARPGRKASWFDDARELFKTAPYSSYDGVVLFEDAPDFSCDWAPDTSDSAERAWARWGNDPTYTTNALPSHEARPTPATDAAGGRVAVVTDDPAALGGDAALVQRLRAQDYTVSVHDDTTVQASYVSGADVVLVTHQTSQTELGRRLRNLGRPVVVWKPSLFGELGLTPGGAGGNGSTARTQSITMVEQDHALAQGRTGGVQVTHQPKDVPIGTPTSAANVVATTAATPTLFVYQRGEQMVGLTAPACRIAAPLPAGGIGSMTADGVKLLDRVVSYAAGECR